MSKQASIQTQIINGTLFIQSVKDGQSRTLPAARYLTDIRAQQGEMAADLHQKQAELTANINWLRDGLLSQAGDIAARRQAVTDARAAIAEIEQAATESRANDKDARRLLAEMAASQLVEQAANTLSEALKPFDLTRFV